MVLSRLTKITGPGVATDTNWVGNNADFTGITTTATSFNIGVTTIHSNLIEAHNIKSTGIITATGGSFSGNVTAVDGTFTGNVSIAGTLTYEDVTNVDSVGIVTAAAVDVDDFVSVGSNIHLGNAGVVTATSFVGDGSGLIGVASTDNIITGTAATFNTYPVDINAGMTVAGVSTFSGSTTLTSSGYPLTIDNSSNAKILLKGSNDPFIRFQEVSTNKAYIQWVAAGYFDFVNEESGERLRIQSGINGLKFGSDSNFYNVWHQGNDGASSGLDADLLDGQEGSYYSPNVGITTNLSGTFTASAGSPSTINTFGYGSGDIVVEYTVFIKNGSDFQSQKLLAMRDGTTIHSTQFAVMFSSSLLVQLDATISGGNILLRATPETGVSGSTTYKIKREVM